MSQHFRDFLSSEQIKHWPSVVYTPQQNAVVERMWGTRFGVARSLLKYAGLGPSWHPFALQTSNWICNRLPQASRNNMSAWYILSKMRASIAYLRSFGCLARFVIPVAQRSGDRHFADRGAIGIYLGPSEVSPGCIIYSPSLRRFFTTRDVICFEDVHPGVKGCDNRWLDVTADATPPPNPETITEPAGQSLLPPTNNMIENRILAQSHILDKEPPDDPVDRQLDPSLNAPSPAVQQPSIDVIPDTELTREDHAVSTDAPKSRKLPKLDSGDINDPSSRAFNRRLPERSTRYRASYVCPTSADCLEAIRNFLYLASESSIEVDSSELWVYESTIYAVIGRLLWLLPPQTWGTLSYHSVMIKRWRRKRASTG